MYASCIAVRGSLLHNYIITKCVNDGKEVTKEMFDMRYMYHTYYTIIVQWIIKCWLEL